MGRSLSVLQDSLEDDVIKLRGGSSIQLLHEELAHGGPGRVCKGKLRIGATCQPVAVKKFQDKAAYEQELLALKRWSGNPNIISLIVSGEDALLKDTLIIVTKMFFGDLRSYFNDCMYPGGWASSPFGDLDVGLMQQISSVLQLMSDTGFAHGDVELSSIFIDKKAERGKLFYRAVLGHIGQSVCLGAVHASGPAGTPLYRAPEIVAPELLGSSRPRHTVQSDKYSYGMVLYSTILRKEIEVSDFPELPGRTDTGAVEAAVVEGLRPQIPNGVPSILKSILQQCWHQSPAERGSFNALTAELQRARGLLN